MEEPYPYLILDARYEKVREDGAVRSQAVLVAIGINWEGRLVHHPYESFDESAEAFIVQATEDPSVVAIKKTVYRVGDDTPFVRCLIRAAESGKQVACVIELRARFDEERNLHWADALVKAGAHVTFGIKGLKIHGKTAVVVRKENDELRTYVHIATGNYPRRLSFIRTWVCLLVTQRSRAMLSHSFTT